MSTPAQIIAFMEIARVGFLLTAIHTSFQKLSIFRAIFFTIIFALFSVTDISHARMFNLSEFAERWAFSKLRELPGAATALLAHNRTLRTSGHAISFTANHCSFLLNRGLLISHATNTRPMRFTLTASLAILF